MESDNTFSELSEILLELVGPLRADRITPDAHIIYDIGIKSIDLLTLIFLCERKFGIEISGIVTDVKQIETVEKLMSIIKQNLINQKTTISD